MTKVRSWIAIESEEAAVAAPEGIEVELVEVPSETVEAQLADSNEADATVENVVADGDEMEEDAERLEEVAEAVDQSLEDEGDGLDETGAKIAGTAVESFTSRWAIKVERPAIESFGDASTRREATLALQHQISVAREGMGQRFMDWVKALLETIKNSIKGLFSVGQSLVNRGNKYLAALNKLEGNPSGKVTVKKAAGLYEGQNLNPTVAIEFCNTAEQKAQYYIKPILSLKSSGGWEKLADDMKAIKFPKDALPGGIVLKNEGGKIVAETLEVGAEAEVDALSKDQMKHAATGLVKAGQMLSGKAFEKIEGELEQFAKGYGSDEDNDGQKLMRSAISSGVTVVQTFGKSVKLAASGVDALLVASMKAAK